MATKKPGLKERLIKKKEELKKGGGNYDTFIFPKEGTYRMRHLPVGEDTEFAVELVQFYIGGDVKSFISPASFGGKCAVMNQYNKLKDKSDEESKNLAKKLKPKKVYGSPAIRYKDDKGKDVDTEAGEKLAILKPGQYDQMIDLYLDEDEAGDFTDPKAGYDLKHIRVGKGQYDTEYSVRACKPTPLPKAYAKKTYDPIEMAKALIPSYEQTKEYLASFMAMPGEDSSSKDTDEAPKKKKKKKTSDL